MEPLAALIVNVGIFVVSAGAAAVAWWQAIAASRNRKASDAAAKAALQAKRDAVAAQEAAADALKEANAIARESKDVIEASEARKIERHHVKWVPHWEWETGKWYLGNHGADVALNVRLSVESPTVGHRLVSEESIEPKMGAVVEFPVYAKQGGMPRVVWRVDWETPLGSQLHDTGVWPD